MVKGRKERLKEVIMGRERGGKEEGKRRERGGRGGGGDGKLACTKIEE